MFTSEPTGMHENDSRPSFVCRSKMVFAWQFVEMADPADAAGGVEEDDGMEDLARAGIRGDRLTGEDTVRASPRLVPIDAFSVLVIAQLRARTCRLNLKRPSSQHRFMLLACLECAPF